MKQGHNSGSEFGADGGLTVPGAPVVRMAFALTLVVLTTTTTSAAIATVAASIP